MTAALTPDEGPRITRLSDRCMVCRGVQKLRADGTFGKHHLWFGSDYKGVCPGTGLTVDEVDELLRATYAR